MSRELLRQALDALKYHRDQTRPIHLTQLAIHAIEDRLAQQDAEPVDTTVIGARLFGATTRLMAALHMERIGEDLLDKAEPSMASVLQDAAENLHEQSAAAWGECISALEAWSNVATSPQQAQPAHAVPTDLMLAASAASAAWKSYWQGGRAHSAAVDFAQAMNALDEAIAAPAAPAVREPHEPYLCIKPACGPDCSGCNCAISPQDMRDYAIRYAILRNAPINAIRGGGVFAGKTPDNVVINGEHLDAAVDALRGITGDSNG